MPIFEYRCTHCGKQFSKLVWSSSTDKPVACPECESFETEKLVSSFASVSQGGSSSFGGSSVSSCGSGGFS